MINIETIRDFWQYFAINHIELQHTSTRPHFTEYDFQEINALIKSNALFPVLGLSSFDDSNMGVQHTYDPKSGYAQVFKGEVIILDKINDRADSFTQRTHIYNKTLEIWNDISAAIMYLAIQNQSGNICSDISLLATRFQLDRCYLNRIAAKTSGANAYGWLIRYEFKEPITWAYNPSKFLP